MLEFRIQQSQHVIGINDVVMSVLRSKGKIVFLKPLVELQILQYVITLWLRDLKSDLEPYFMTFIGLKKQFCLLVLYDVQVCSSTKAVV